MACPRGQRDQRSGVRRLKEIDLWEISVVTFPMQPNARILSVRSAPFAGRVPTTREFERWLTRDAGLTRSQARALMRDIREMADSTIAGAPIRKLHEPADRHRDNLRAARPATGERA